LEKVALEGCIVTIDAMGGQYRIAAQIVEKKADYLFSLKGNQETLREDVKKCFEGLDFSVPTAKNPNIRFESFSPHEEKHGRIADRDCAAVCRGGPAKDWSSGTRRAFHTPRLAAFYAANAPKIRIEGQILNQTAVIGNILYALP
jgi:hypothetical protein